MSNKPWPCIHLQLVKVEGIKSKEYVHGLGLRA